MNPLICWDTSVLIDCIHGDKADPDRMQRINSVADYVEANSYRLVFSALVYAEMLEGKRTEGGIKQFKNFMKNRKKIEVINVDIRVAEKAGKIRSESERNIETPDAVHIATAIISGAQMFHTFDDGLLRLNGKEEVNGLSITACEIP
ncbi:MAG: PIN domain-containing protein [Candidatus Dadabacteria bacterium]|nr:PIN domain-containing protein [Candidatus Dadabacteria bacterium]